MIPTRCKNPSRLFVGIDVSWWCMVAFSIVCKAADDPADKAPGMRPILCGWLADLLRGDMPAYVAAFLDSPVKTWRHIATEHLPADKQYKAGRTARPPEYYDEVRGFVAILKLHRIPCYQAPGWEADDVAATVTRHAVATGLDVALVTLDHDWRALVRDAPAVYCWSYGRSKPTEIGPAELLADPNHGVAPHLVPSMIALCGDGDNIKGVKGLGPTKAQIALERFGSIAGILGAESANLDALMVEVDQLEKARNKSARALGKASQATEAQIEDLRAASTKASHDLDAARINVAAEKYRGAIVAAREDVELGLTLATLDPYAPLDPPFDLASCAVGGFDVAELVKVYGRYGFTVMAGDVAGATAPKSTEAA